MSLWRMWGRSVLAAAFLLTVAGCAGERAYREGMELSNKGRFEEGLEKIELAVRQAPDNPQYRMALLNRRTDAVHTLLLSAESALGENRLDDAEAQYARVQKLEKDNARAQEGLKQVEQARRHQSLMAEAAADFNAGEMNAAMEKIRAVTLENPKQRDALALLKKMDERQVRNKFTQPALKKYTSPVTLEFRDAPVKMVFDVLSGSTGINFILDKDMRPDQRVSVFAKGVTLDKALSLLLEANQLARKIINENTLLVYQRTPQKSKEYDELVVRTFYLANADPKQTANMLKIILKVKDIYVDERLNMMVVRDVPEVVAQAEKLIAVQDLPEPEVLLEVAVLEVKRDHLLNLGVQPPTQFGVLNTNPVVNGAQTPLTINVLRGLNRNSITVNGPAPGLSADEQFSDVNVLANPRIRVRNREKAKVYIGDRVPVITSTVTTTTGAPVTAETVQYVDTGIKLDVESNIYLEGDVSIKVNLEVNSLGTKTTTNNGSVVYQTGTRTASTLLRLKDGETQLLAGLINDEDRTSINGLPGLAALPLIGRLFASHQDSRQKTEVVLSITPHIVRNIPLPKSEVTQFWSGTEEGRQGSYSESFISQDGVGGQQFAQPGMPPVPVSPFNLQPGMSPGMPPAALDAAGGGATPAIP